MAGGAVSYRRRVEGTPEQALALADVPRAVGGLGPLAVGFLPGRFGLARVLAGLMLVPMATLVTLKRRDLLPAAG